VVRRFKAILTVILAALSLGAGIPQALCVVTTAKAATEYCCCAGMAGCQCPHAKPCGPSCARVQVQSFDQQAPVRTAQLSFATSYVLLFSIAPVKINNIATNSSGRRSDTNASLSFNGSPPQALLCLWRI